MSDSENELFGADLGDSASISSAVRRSSRILSRQDDSSASISDMPKAHLSTLAPSLEFSQPLALAGVIGNSPIQVVLPASPGTSAPGKKHAKKINTAPPAKRKSVSASFAPPDHPDVPLHSSNSILQSLLSSMQAIDAHLQSLEKIQALAMPTASGNPPPIGQGTGSSCTATMHLLHKYRAKPFSGLYSLSVGHTFLSGLIFLPVQGRKFCKVKTLTSSA